MYLDIIVQTEQMIYNLASKICMQEIVRCALLLAL